MSDKHEKYEYIENRLIGGGESNENKKETSEYNDVRYHACE